MLSWESRGFWALGALAERVEACSCLRVASVASTYTKVKLGCQRVCLRSLSHTMIIGSRLRKVAGSWGATRVCDTRVCIMCLWVVKLVADMYRRALAYETFA